MACLVFIGWAISYTNEWVSEQKKTLKSFGSFAYFPGCVQPFCPYPYFKKLNKSIGANDSLESEAQKLLSEFCA